MKSHLIAILFLVPLLSLAQFGRNAPDVSFYWGQSYRLNNHFYNSFDISYEHYRSSCLNASYQGFGVRFDNFNNSNYSLSIKYFRSLTSRLGLLMVPYFCISPVMFDINDHKGFNMKPEFGLRFNTGAFTRRQPVSLSLNVSYGYDIPLVNEKDFTIGRHDFSARIALTFNLHDIRRMLKRPQPGDSGTPPAPGKKE